MSSLVVFAIFIMFMVGVFIVFAFILRLQEEEYKHDTDSHRNRDTTNVDHRRLDGNILDN